MPTLGELFTVAKDPGGRCFDNIECRKFRFAVNKKILISGNWSKNIAIDVVNTVTEEETTIRITFNEKWEQDLAEFLHTPIKNRVISLDDVRFEVDPYGDITDDSLDKVKKRVLTVAKRLPVEKDLKNGRKKRSKRQMF